MGRWLQDHDRDTGDLCGMLPLALGMRVALTDHLDRSPDKLLLRGRAGYIHSWVWEENDRLPQVVYVKFENSGHWSLSGIDEPGVYPIYPVKRQWHLDAKRKQKLLKVTRTQLPLTPAYAMTAHASQGKTLRAVLLDLNVDKRVDGTFGTVAASRVRHREDVLILRPFPRWLFSRGEAEGPTLLLQTLRGEEVDWKNYRDARFPSAACEKCKQVRCFDAFDHKQWENIRANRAGICMQCIHGDDGPAKRKISGNRAKIFCAECHAHKIEDAFPRALLTLDAGQKRCLSCAQQVRALTCAACSSTKPVEKFQATMVTMPAESIMCQHCQAEARDLPRQSRERWFTCFACNITYAGRPYQDEKAWGKNQRARRCANCVSRSSRQEDEHTCRNAKCKRKWQEHQPKGSKRQRYCPECRRK